MRNRYSATLPVASVWLVALAILFPLGQSASGGVPESTAAQSEPETDSATSNGDTADQDTRGVRLGKSQTQRLQVGMTITAAPGSSCRGVFASVPVPADWPEQKVKIVDQEVSQHVGRITYRELEGVKQMLVQIPQLPPGQSAEALVTFEVERFELLPPDDPTVFKVPRRIDRELRQFIGQSPMIETHHSNIRVLADELRNEELPAWEQVEAIYDYVRDHIEYREGQIKGAAAALEDNTGDCEEMTSLFVALCRVQRIPARCVWVTDHCYPEFYLVDDKDQGHWIPCQVAGTRAFGSMPEVNRIILQKGDNIFVPERKSRERYVSEFLKVVSLRGNPPQVEFVRRFADSP